MKSGVPFGVRPPDHITIMGGNEQPWLVSESIEYIYKHIDKDMSCYEYGAGSSTFWFSKFTKKVTSVESDSSWYSQVVSKRDELSIDNIVIELCECPMISITNTDYETDQSYKRYADSIFSTGETFDLILVDGVARSLCIRNALCALKAGGLLIIDNAERPAYSEAISLIPKPWKLVEFNCSVDRTLVYHKTK